MPAPLSLLDLQNAARDLQTIFDVGNSSSPTTTTRLGATIDTLQGAISKLHYNVPVAHTNGLSVTSLVFTVISSGIVYAPLPAAIPFTTTGSFDPSKWYPIFPTVSGFMATVLDDPDAATARATLGAGTGTLNLSDVIGKQTVWLPAGSWKPQTTNGPTIGSVEIGSNPNQVMLDYLSFNQSTQQHAQCKMEMPKGLNAAGTIEFAFRWSHPSTSTNFAVVWGIQGFSLADNEIFSGTFGTAQEVTDTGGVTNQHYKSAYTSAVSISGLAAEELAVLRVYRKAADGADTLNVAARLEGVVMRYTTSAPTDT